LREIEDFRKISCIKWYTICLNKGNGDLGVSTGRKFNLALLGNWCLRMLEERKSLWYRVLVGRYGDEGG